MSKPGDNLELNKFEMKEQEGVSAGQASQATAWINLSHILDTLCKLLNSTTLDVVLAQKVSEQGLNVGRRSLASRLEWQEIFAEVRKHLDQVSGILDQEQHLHVAMKKTLEQIRELPRDAELIARVKELNAVLDHLERHRASGLLEAITKL